MWDAWPRECGEVLVFGNDANEAMFRHKESKRSLNPVLASPKWKNGLSIFYMKGTEPLWLRGNHMVAWEVCAEEVFVNERNWREVHNEELYDLQASPHNFINIMICWRRIRWVRAVIRMDRYETRAGLRKESMKERDHLQGLVVDGSILQ